MRIPLTIALSALAAAGIAAGAWVLRTLTHASRLRRRAARAGLVEKRCRLSSGTRLAYAEGPPNGPALLLLHAQSAAWESYANVLPDLARDFHVFAIDFAGHGSSDRTPGRYDVHAIGRDVVDVIDRVIGEPVILSGHSSGGLVAAWVAAEVPDRVRGIVFEDPPFFSTEPDRMPQQFNYVDLAKPAHDFLQQSDERDFVAYYLGHNAWIEYFGSSRDRFAAYAHKRRRRHPDGPFRFWFMPPSTNETFAYMHEFDPRFADAFYRGSWQAGFDQRATLAKVTAPSILIHANWRMTDAGILEGAMTDEDAARAAALMADCRIERVDTGHGFHVEAPERFVALLREIARTATTAQAGTPRSRA
jgi:pimeloyl-ACP methyl ester carboxylesterase